METLTIDDVELCYEILGKENNKTILLIPGLGSQMIRWEDSFCRLLSGQGFRIIRFDNRDSGASVFTGQKEMTSGRSIEELFSNLKKEDLPYSLTDMAQDVIRLLNHLQIDKAHIIGRSMGGIIAQILGAFHPERLISMTIIMSTSLNPELPPPDPEVMRMMTKPPADPVTEKEAYIREKLNFAQSIAGTIYPLDTVKEISLIEEELNRSRTKNGMIRQLMAMGSYQYNPDILKRITVPSLIIHGTDDLIFHPDCAKDLHAGISDSQLILIDGMGHSIPAELFGLLSRHILSLTK
ncbi:alpha/beta hydrolase [Chryseobacterium sp.]|uniref:alpha/beta fold hydrolase n=1 Tax=Chryseobacterium sp. TaxID=1871047 RepID=UPI0025C16C41|nr:alpha/beta hydrolase [Chryseobacterium sp.]MBV8326348.1 alpha/beta hydrolase [Chryseobacterium sp.]